MDSQIDSKTYSELLERQQTRLGSKHKEVREAAADMGKVLDYTTALADEVTQLRADLKTQFENWDARLGALSEEVRVERDNSASWKAQATEATQAIQTLREQYVRFSNEFAEETRKRLEFQLVSISLYRLLLELADHMDAVMRSLAAPGRWGTPKVKEIARLIDNIDKIEVAVEPDRAGQDFAALNLDTDR